MPAVAYLVLALFTAVSLVTGFAGAWLFGPRRRWTPVLPTLAAFGSLYVVGHRFAATVGPQVRLFGFELSLLFDTAVAVTASFAVAAVQAVAARLLQTQQRRARRDRLA